MSNHQSYGFPANFLSKIAVDEETGCWMWTAYVYKTGYGSFRVEGKTWFAHRYACTFVHGTAPAGKPLALHSCDRHGCVNPEHLSWGDHRENMNHVIARGNGRKPRVKREK